MSAGTPGGASAREAVVLLHGLWMNRFIMLPLARRLAAQGYATHLFGYPSLARDIDANAASLARFLGAIEAPALHLVGHSLGGVTLLASLQARPDPRVRRVVLLGAPVRGAAAVRRLLATAWGRALVGSGARRLAAPPSLEVDPRIEIGTLAGTRRLGMAAMLAPVAGAGDGAVLVEETRHPQARDAIALRVSHSGMLFSPEVARQVAHFLQDGRFAR
ncbi:MAG: alpha/beta fold hydrolase [Burkholderiales bacterium]|nr:alpha/beta fold hydrolase [Burkholderiales bacterium]